MHHTADKVWVARFLEKLVVVEFHLADSLIFFLNVCTLSEYPLLFELFAMLFEVVDKEYEGLRYFLLGDDLC
jgi:hypothetical protein